MRDGKMKAAALEYQHPHSLPHHQQQSLAYSQHLHNATDNMTAQQMQQRPSTQFPHHSAAPLGTSNVATVSDAQKSTFFSTTGPQPPISCDIKPRLTKEQHDILEAHFQEQNKPSTITKKNFAETLNVSLEKVNNWFQNRRAKSKQDAKKQAGTLASTPVQQQQQQRPVATEPFNNQQRTQITTQAPDVKPLDGAVFPTTDYYPVLHSSSLGERSLPSQPPVASIVSAPETFAGNIPLYPGLFEQPTTLVDQHASFAATLQPPHSMFESAQELNRRTLTQEQFDAFAQTAPLPVGTFDIFQPGFTFDHDVYSPGDTTKLQEIFYPMPSHIPESLSSYDSTLPSSTSEMFNFPTSDWGDSRSSSVSGLTADESFNRAMAAASTPQWQPGQSVPVDVHALNEEFQKAAHARRMSQDQSFSWPSEEMLRNDTQAALLAQQMSHVELQTPQPQSNHPFKAPPPSSSIATRRQRPRPAALGPAALRSQSYSGAAQPLSPGANGQHTGMAAGQSLRRIRSSNVITGVSHGRIQKSIPGSAQRSPLSYTFTDSMISPTAVQFL